MLDFERIEKLWELWATCGSIPDDGDFAALTEAYETFVKLEDIFRPASAARTTLDTLKRCNNARKERQR